MVIVMNSTMTVLPNSEIETEITDETDLVSNDAFLTAVFGSDLTDTLPIIVSFTGNPSKVAKGKWFGQVWQSGITNIDVNANNYFSLATFHANEDGNYRRQKANFDALYAVMLDDIGSKVAAFNLAT